jgi:DNA-binding HxlR family transcriptional regulator
MEHEPVQSAFCPYFHSAVELIGARWTGAIIRAMLAGRTRFTDITCAIPGLSDRMLSERLKELETEGVVQRHVIPSTPVRIEYCLTEKGQALAAVVSAISTWATDWSGAPAGEPAAVAAAPASPR